jgi:hypothetical protein
MKKILFLLLTLVLFLTFVSAASAERAALETQGLKVASINWTNAHGWRSVYDAQLREVAEEYKKLGSSHNMMNIVPIWILLRKLPCLKQQSMKDMTSS